jgi:pyridoxal phosphate enzyme (YggS family)
LPITWHFIGRLQANKTRGVAAAFDWVHSVDRERLAARLDEHRPPDQPRLKVLLQVRLGSDTERGGVDADALPALAESVSAMPRLELKGLMCMPEPAFSEAAQRAPFRRLRELLHELNRRGFSLDALSMGMSGDLEAAIAEGATIVRVGTAIFGPRS